MKNLSILMLLCAFLVNLNSYAQDNVLNLPQDISPFRPLDCTSFALGAGLEYGGFGGNLLIYPQKNIGLFGGIGYALAGMGYNVGLKYRIISKKHFSNPYALALYGYNAAIIVKNAEYYNKLFYGPTLGVGVDFHSRKMKSNYWTMAVLLPLRKPAVNEYIQDLKNHSGVQFQNGLMPITFSIGYRISSMEF